MEKCITFADVCRGFGIDYTMFTANTFITIHHNLRYTSYILILYKTLC